jgi:hypothetical protein
LNNTKALKGIIEPGIDFAFLFHVVGQSPPGQSGEALLPFIPALSNGAFWLFHIKEGKRWFRDDTVMKK